MTTEFIMATEGAVKRITLAQPDLGNTLSLEAMRELAAVIDEAGRDPALKIIRIDAQGGVFCKGRAAGKPPAVPPNAAEFRQNVTEPILGVYRAMHESQIPVIAVAQGDAEGFGCALVSGCDLAVAADSARFSLPEMQKNLPPTLVLSVLRHKVPPKAAAHMVYLADTVDAATARDWGLLSEVVPAAQLTARADAMVASIVSRERIAVATLKTYFREVIFPGFSLASEAAGTMLSVAMTSQRRG